MRGMILWEGSEAPRVEAQRSGPGTKAVEAIALDGRGRTRLRPDRLWRNRRGLAARRAQQFPSAKGERTSRLRCHRRQGAARAWQLALAATDGCCVDGSADRVGREADLLR